MVNTKEVMEKKVDIGYTFLEAIEDSGLAHHALDCLCYYLSVPTTKLSPFNEEIAADMAQELARGIHDAIATFTKEKQL
tara:strand:+ start:511 stop:747 length:237 start_codon:yes stop_codon:yes gene_type:complete